MKLRHWKGLVAIVLGVVAAGFSYEIYSRWRAEQTFLNTHEGKPIPPEGLILNESGSTFGDPENARKDMRRIHAALMTFRARYLRLPATPWELLDAGKAGIVDLNEDDYVNPDVRYADNEQLQRTLAQGEPIPLNVSYGFEWCNSKEPFPKRPVKWLSSWTYQRNQGRIFRGRRYEYEPFGFYLYLWSDGRITEEPIAEKMMVRDGKDWRPIDLKQEDAKGREVISEVELYKRLERGSLFSKDATAGQ
ncbi:MAG TPA: hypothetical protein VM328_04340 [Fimbriimonadaceae bacterium]|nr:hypothetical protein [Fimbriimonadaceae bacterium]